MQVNSDTVLRRNEHLIAVLNNLKGREDLYYLEYASIGGISPSYAYYLFKMLSIRFGLNYRNGFLDNPGDEKLDEFIRQLEDERRKVEASLKKETRRAYPKRRKKKIEKRHRKR